MTKCSIYSCTSGAPGQWEPVLLCWAERSFPGTHAPGEVKIHNTYLCTSCRIRVRPWDLVTPESWKKIQAAFIHAGKTAPSLRTATLTWITPDSLKVGGQRV